VTRRPAALLAAYLVVLVALTFFPFEGLSGGDPVDLRLQAFRTINFALREGIGSREFAVLIGNVAAFVPLGVLLPQVLRRKSVLLVLVIALALSLAIEVGAARHIDLSRLRLSIGGHRRRDRQRLRRFRRLRGVRDRKSTHRT